MSQQLTFEWPTGVKLGAEDFFVSDANRAAYGQVLETGWPMDKLVLVGPEGCGKSHLARVYAAATGAVIVAARDVVDDTRPMGAIVVEDMQNLPSSAEAAMFHLHNRQASAGQQLLMTAREMPTRWTVGLPDLASRMHATTPVQIDDPDDALLQALLMKLFADRQIAVSPALIGYLSTRIERSFAAAQRMVSAMDAAALEEKCAVSTRLAARLLDNEPPADP